MNNIQKLLDAVLTPMQDVEDALMQCLNDRTIDNATGINLDIIGKLVGEPRGTYADDDEYRIGIRARVQANRSSGTIENHIKVAKLIINDATAHFKVENHGRANVIVRVQDVLTSDSLAALLIRFLNDTASGGVRVIAQYGNTSPSGWAKFDTAGRGFDTGKFVGSVDNSTP